MPEAGNTPVAPPTSSIYAATELEREIRQGEIITDLREYVFDPVGGIAQEIVHDFVVVLSQDCDLLQDFDARARAGSAEVLRMVLFNELESVPACRDRIAAGSDIWKRIAQNKDERFHFFETIPTQSDLLTRGMPELVADFRRHFTVPAVEVYRQCTLGSADRANRRCRMIMPYREHLQCRAAFYLMRVGIPAPHQIAGKSLRPQLPQ
jgi:hypothetical protein